MNAKPAKKASGAPLIAVWLQWPVGAFRLGAASLARLRELAPPDARVEVCRSRAAFLRALPEATHALVWEFDAKWFARAPRLRVLATPSAGRELLPAEVPPGVTKWHGRFHGPIIAETVLALMLAHCRGVFAALGFRKAGNPWPRAELSPFCRTLAGTRAVILGYGAIGKEIGRRLRALGVSVVGVRRRNFARLDAELPRADWLVLALPSDTGTDDLVDARRLALLPRRAALVNVGRGNAVDERALAAALRARRLSAALLDVVKDEPLKPGSPLAEDLPGLVLLPHASAFSPDYLERFFAELARNGLLR